MRTCHVATGVTRCTQGHARRCFLALAGAAVASSVLPRTGRAAAAAEDLRNLAASLTGELVSAGHPLYDSARRTASFNPRFDRRPLAMVGVRSEDDIARAIGFAGRASRRAAGCAQRVTDRVSRSARSTLRSPARRWP